MSGTPSRTATARSRGRVGRKLEANSRPEEHESHTRHRISGRGGVGTRSPMTSGLSDVDAAGVGGRSRALPWETLRSAFQRVVHDGIGCTVPQHIQARPWCPHWGGSEYVVQANCSVQLGQSQDCARDRKESAEAIGATCRWQRAKHKDVTWCVAFADPGDADIWGCPRVELGDKWQNYPWPSFARQGVSACNDPIRSKSDAN